jgi:hypothetical protein
MGYFDKLAALNFMVICRRNGLGTTTMFAVTQDELNMDIDWNINTFLDSLPEWRLVDFVGDDAAEGARLLYEKLTYTGHYAGYDERINGYGVGPEFLIGFEHRHESERYQAVEDAPAPPPELVENLNLSEGGE